MDRNSYQNAVYEKLSPECVISISRSSDAIEAYCRQVNILYNQNVPVHKAAKSMSKRWTKPYTAKKKARRRR